MPRLSTVGAGPGGAGTGNVVGPAASVDGEIALYSGITGKLLKRATGSGVVHATSGVYSVANVVESEITLADNTTNNVATTKHGFAPKLPNDATKYLDGTGAYTTPPGTGVSGALILLEQQTASSSASLDFTSFISSTYDTYIFELLNVLPATSTDDLWLRMGTGGGPTWDTGANYTWAHGQNSQIPNATNLGTAGDTKIKLAHSLSNTSTDGVCGYVRLYTPQSTASHKFVTAQLTNVDSAGNFVQVHDAGRYSSTTAVTGIRFLMSSGNIASGTIRVYGLTK